MPHRTKSPLDWPQLAARLFAPSLRPAWLVLLIGLISCALMWQLTAEMVRGEARSRFEDVSSQFSSRIEQTMTAYEQVLRGARAMMLTKPDLSRDEFKTFVDTLDIGSAYPGIQAVGFSMVVAPEAKAAHERSMRDGGYADYAITPEGDRPLYTAIVRIQPETNRNLRAIGYDMYSDPVRQAAMDAARDSNQAVLSHRVTLVQETSGDVQPGFLLYFPVYSVSPPPETAEDRRSKLRGFVYAPFRAGKLFDGIRSKDAGGAAGHFFDVRIYDGDKPDPAGLLYETPAAGDERPRYSITSGLKRYGNAWTMVYSSTPAFEDGIDYSKAYMAVLATLLGTAMLSGFVAAMALRQAQLTQANAQMSLLTRELSHRVKNTLAVVQSVASRSLSDGRSVSEARNIFMKRLHALARAHTLLLDKSWQGASLRTLARQELEPFAARATIEGPEVALNASTAQTFALVLHELATNATKHGSLSVLAGRVEVTWRIERRRDAAAMFRFRWREIGGPLVSEPTRRGFGRILLAQHIGHGGDRPTITYHPSGLIYELATPLGSITDIVGDDAGPIVVDRSAE